MKNNINLDSFISKFITKRQKSLVSEDLAKFDTELRHRINGKNVLVIGGAGSIGTNFIKALLKFEIRKLVIVDTNENGLTELVRDLRSSTGYNIPEEFTTYPVNFGDFLFEKIFNTHGPFNIVTNFAAHKHVRSEKDVYSIEAMLENNVLRARNLLDILLKSPPDHFFCVSTDKAANPVNIMGASKKLMEELIISYSDKLQITTARFANVAFSNGSLPQGFLERINKNQPLSCPRDIRRFFVSPQESGEICLLAAIMGNTGDIFFPKLNENKDMISFDKIAMDLLLTLGLEPDICNSESEARLKSKSLNDFSKSYPIYIFGSETSGEKPFEEFFTDNEELDINSFISLGIVKNAKKRSIFEINEILNQLSSLFRSKITSKTEIINTLKYYLPNFEHIEKGKVLDSQM